MLLEQDHGLCVGFERRIETLLAQEQIEFGVAFCFFLKVGGQKKKSKVDLREELER
jgi:hypothetical protein